MRGCVGLRLGFVFVMAAAALQVSAQVKAPEHLAAAHESVANLGELKTKLLAYHDCMEADCYTPEIERQSDVAIAYLDKRAAHVKSGEKLALVLDIDETALSNWEEEKRDDFGYIPKDWNAWVFEKKATVIAGTLRLFNDAKLHGVDVFFITGRGKDSSGQNKDQTQATVENLESAGYHGWAGLALRGAHAKTESTTDYKSAERQKLVAAGYTIIVNVGDQISDLNGPAQGELSVKLPDPFYFIP